MTFILLYIFSYITIASAFSNRDVTFAAPLLDYGYAPTVQELQTKTISNKPILLYLPGFDGTYICPFIQFPELGTEFEVWCMTVGMKDRSTFEELKESVLDFVSSSTQKRQLYLAGESFGGILALHVAQTLSKSSESNLQGLILINPATSYDRSALFEQGPPVAKLAPFLYPFGLIKLLPLFTDEFSFEQLLLILNAKALPSVIDNPAKEAYMGRVAISLPFRLEYMPQETLHWRLTQWLETGCKQIKANQANLPTSLKTVIIAGEKDETLPSVEEAERLSTLLPENQVHVVEGAGHASTCGSRIDMTAVLRSAFPELNEPNSSSRTAMKEEATNGKGPYFGMTERYDGADVGLNPMRYWSKEYFQSVSVEKQLIENGKGLYQKAVYSIPQH